VTNRILDKARAEVEKGNLWRAKEILQGAIRSNSYDVQLFEMLGTVFLRMGDLPEAGRFLFLSGVRNSEYLEAIEIFLSRNRGKAPQNLLQHLPRKARLRTLSDYPFEVAQALRELGFPETLKDEKTGRYLPQTGNDIVVWLTCGTIALVTLTLIILGAMKLREMIR
jgi:hypothetical protein